MKLVRVDAYALEIPPPTPKSQSPEVDTFGRYHLARDQWTAIYSDRHETCLVRLESDEGLVGWGEGQAPVSPRTVQSIVEDLCRPVLLGADPFDVEYLWYRLYSAMRERGHITGFYIDALAGVDLALYDLLGKALNKPVHRLLGGRFRERVNVYVGIGGNTPEQTAQAAVEYLDHGYRAFKIHTRANNRQILDSVEAVRKAVGDEIELLVDVHTTRDVSEAIELGHGLEQWGVRWLEAPCQPEDVHGHAEIARALALQVATGEWLRTAWEWRQWIEQRAFDVAMPDIARSGLSEGKRIAGLLDSFNLPVAPHVGGGGVLSVAAAVQFAAAVPNFQILEYSPKGQNHRARICRRYPTPVDGAFVIDDTPGIGIEVDPEAVAEFSLGSTSPDV